MSIQPEYIERSALRKLSLHTALGVAENRFSLPERDGETESSARCARLRRLGEKISHKAANIHFIAGKFSSTLRKITAARDEMRGKSFVEKAERRRRKRMSSEGKSTKVR